MGEEIGVGFHQKTSEEDIWKRIKILPRYNPMKIATKTTKTCTLKEEEETVKDGEGEL